MMRHYNAQHVTKILEYCVIVSEYVATAKFPKQYTVFASW